MATEPGAHLIGSVPLENSETVFRAVAGTLGPHLRRLPDGETGERRRWIWFQRQMLERHPAIEIDPTVPLFTLRHFQVCLPTPMASAYMYVSPKAREPYIRAYDAALRSALEEIVASIPGASLAIQWDVCQEAELNGFEATTLYLGVIHHDDRAGDLARIRAARGFAPAFGIASECGWGRTDPERVPRLLESHRVAVKEMS